MSKTDDWGLLKQQFDALMHAESAEGESVDEIFDLQFRRRFAELIYETAKSNDANELRWPRR
jgi:hypothetical protein